jgi:hypothetical protein
MSSIVWPLAIVFFWKRKSWKSAKNADIRDCESGSSVASTCLQGSEDGVELGFLQTINTVLVPLGA